MKNFVTADEFKNARKDNAVVIDVRFNMQKPDEGFKKYKKEHVKNAFYMDLDKDMTGLVGETGGKHPLPEKDIFEKKLRSFGVQTNSEVYIYDDSDNAAAGRLWFLLKYFGIICVKIVSGGFESIKNADVPMDVDMVTSPVPESDLKLKENKELLASFEEVKNHSESPIKGRVLIDSRAFRRYTGEIEPLYSKAGHIPNAINYDYSENFIDGKIKSVDELKERFKDMNGFNDIIVSCGSGVTACSNILGLDEAGYKARLYTGSYSDWVSRNMDVNIGDSDNFKFRKNK